MAFPATRLRRLRRTAALRSMVRETRLTPEAFIYPLFVCPGEGVRKEVRSMPGVFNLSVDEAVKEARATKAARAIKREVPDLVIMGDVCLCEYMSHGHCGIVKSAATPQSLGAAAVASPP